MFSKTFVDIVITGGATSKYIRTGTEKNKPIIINARSNESFGLFSESSEGHYVYQQISYDNKLLDLFSYNATKVSISDSDISEDDDEKLAFGFKSSLFVVGISLAVLLCCYFVYKLISGHKKKQQNKDEPETKPMKTAVTSEIDDDITDNNKGN